MVKKRKKPYPRGGDIARAIYKVLTTSFLMPEEFVEAVKSELKESGFFVGLVSAKRIWKVYEELVRKGRIEDILGVIPTKEKDEL